jgi:hypothetical protein
LIGLFQRFSGDRCAPTRGHSRCKGERRVNDREEDTMTGATVRGVRGGRKDAVTRALLLDITDPAKVRP